MRELYNMLTNKVVLSFLIFVFVMTYINTKTFAEPKQVVKTDVDTAEVTVK